MCQILIFLPLPYLLGRGLLPVRIYLDLRCLALLHKVIFSSPHAPACFGVAGYRGASDDLSQIWPISDAAGPTLNAGSARSFSGVHDPSSSMSNIWQVLGGLIFQIVNSTWTMLGGRSNRRRCPTCRLFGMVLLVF